MKFVTYTLASMFLLQTVWSACPVEDDPTNLARCIQVDVSAIVAAAKGSTDLSSFCALADRYMECIKTYTRGCIGFYFGEGTLTELQNIALYCCNGITSTKECPFNPNVPHTCIDADATAVMSDGTLKRVDSLEIGNKVKTLDHNGNLIDTDVVMMMDISRKESLFLNIQTYSNKNIRVSGSHLMAVPNGEFKFAKRLNRDDTIVTFNFENNSRLEERIKSILIEPVDGFAAPLTLTGTLLVNNVLTSNYAVIENQQLAHAVMAPARWWYMSVNHALNNAGVNWQIEKQETGFHWFPQILHAFTHTYLNSIVKFH